MGCSDEAGADSSASKSHRCFTLSSSKSACNLASVGSVKNALKSSRCLAFSIFTKSSSVADAPQASLVACPVVVDCR